MVHCRKTCLMVQMVAVMRTLFFGEWNISESTLLYRSPKGKLLFLLQEARRRHCKCTEGVIWKNAFLCDTLTNLLTVIGWDRKWKKLLPSWRRMSTGCLWEAIAWMSSTRGLKICGVLPTTSNQPRQGRARNSTVVRFMYSIALPVVDSGKTCGGRRPGFASSSVQPASCLWS